MQGGTDIQGCRNDQMSFDRHRKEQNQVKLRLWRSKSKRPFLSSQAKCPLIGARTLSTNASPMITPKTVLYHIIPNINITALTACENEQLAVEAFCGPPERSKSTPLLRFFLFYSTLSAISREMNGSPSHDPQTRPAPQNSQFVSTSPTQRHHLLSLLTSFIYGRPARITPVATNELRLRFRGVVASALIASRLVGRGRYGRRLSPPHVAFV